MRATGIVRRIDDLGRVVIPKEIRRSMGIREGDPLEIFTENGTIGLRKYSPIGDFDLETIKKICDAALGELNYTLYDKWGEPLLPITAPNLDISNKGVNVCDIKCDGEVIGFLQSPSGNKETTADIIGSLMA